MKKLFLFVMGVFFIAAFSKAYRRNKRANTITTRPGDAYSRSLEISQFKIMGLSFAPGQRIPQEYGCDGQDINPPLRIFGIPKETESMALILEDPDSPFPPVFDHWLLCNIPPDTTDILEGTLPNGAVQGTNSLGHVAYNGPCPPNGTHHYHFKLFALNCQLDLSEGFTKKDLKKAMKGHILAHTEIVGLYTANRATQKELVVDTAKSLHLTNT